MVLTGLIEKPLEVVHRRPHRTLALARAGQNASHAGAACPPAVAIVAAGHGHSLLKALLAPLVAAFDALLGAVCGDVGRCLLVAAWCCLTASLCRVKHDCLVAGGLLGGDATRLLKLVPEEVVMSALPQALRAVLGQRARTALVSSTVNLGLTVLTLLPPQRDLV
jgi:hypothetical protein